MSEFRAIEVYTSQTNYTNPNAMFGELSLPYQIPLLLISVTMIAMLMKAASNNIARSDGTQNALKSKRYKQKPGKPKEIKIETLEKIQKRLIEIQASYYKRVKNGVYNYYDPKVVKNNHLTYIDKAKKQTMLKPSFIDFLNNLIKTLDAEHELKFKNTKLSDDPDKTFNYYKKTAIYSDTDSDQNCLIQLEFILSYKTTNWIVTFVENENI